MTNSVRLWRVGLSIVALGALALVVTSSVRDDHTARIDNGGPNPHPALFGEHPDCPSRGGALQRGVRAEEMARFRSDRYPYDPRDGVLAVQGFRTATNCYDAAGRPSDADRTRAAGQELAERMGTDYAAARLSLANAIETKRWAEVLRETHHLLLLTSHLGGHHYVKWLVEIAGKASAHHHGPS